MVPLQTCLDNHLVNTQVNQGLLSYRPYLEHVKPQILQDRDGTRNLPTGRGHTALHVFNTSQYFLVNNPLVLREVGVSERFSYHHDYDLDSLSSRHSTIEPFR